MSPPVAWGVGQPIRMVSAAYPVAAPVVAPRVKGKGAEDRRGIVAAVEPAAVRGTVDCGAPLALRSTPTMPSGIEAVLRNKDLIAGDQTLAESCANAQEELERLRSYAQTLAHLVKDERVLADLSKMSELLRRSSTEIGGCLQTQTPEVN